MSTNYEKYNEITFLSYCKNSISNAVLRGRIEKAKYASCEISIETLNDNILFSFGINSAELESADFGITVFEAAGFHVAVHDPDIAQALSFLVKKKRDILLLYYFMDMTDQEIGEYLHINMHTVRYRRLAALRDLKLWMDELK